MQALPDSVQIFLVYETQVICIVLCCLNMSPVDVVDLN